MLLDRGCPLDVADSRGGDTVLHLATRAGDNAILAVLLRKGANPDIANKVSYYISAFLGYLTSSASVVYHCNSFEPNFVNLLNPILGVERVGETTIVILAPAGNHACMKLPVKVNEGWLTLS